MNTLLEEHAVLQGVLDAFTEETRGDPWPGVTQGTIRLQTVPGVFVTAYRGAEGWWDATLSIHDDKNAVVAGSGRPFFSVPLKQGPVWYEDSETTVQDVVTWLRTITDAEPDHDCHEHAQPYTSDGPLGHGWECGRCGAFLQAG